MNVGYFRLKFETLLKLALGILPFSHFLLGSRTQTAHLTSQTGAPTPPGRYPAPDSLGPAWQEFLEPAALCAWVFLGAVIMFVGWVGCGGLLKWI